MEQSEISTPVLLEDLGMLYPTETSIKKARYGIYKCSCGNTFKVMQTSIRNGHTTSCGCYHKSKVSTHNLRNNRLYSIWKQIIDRTSNESNANYKNYGARGIAVCDRWLNVTLFIEDMFLTYEEGLTIDRIDNNKGYSPENCRWVTHTVQHRNTRKIYSHNTSGYRGVSYEKSTGKWMAGIRIDNKSKNLGRYTTSIEAAKAYDSYVIANNLEHTINGVLNLCH